MYCLNDEQVTYILNDIRRNGIEMEDLQLNLLDHICCIIEQGLEDDGDFKRYYHEVIKQFYQTELHEIEKETILLLTFKNYYLMKKIMIVSGGISTCAFLLGSFLKVAHAPGAVVMLFLGAILFSLLFLPTLLFIKTKEAGNLAEKAVMITGILSGMCYVLSLLFILNHWVGGITLHLAALASLVFIFIPVYYFTGIRKAENKLNTTVVAVLLIAVSCLQFALVKLHKDNQSNKPVAANYTTQSVTK